MLLPFQNPGQQKAFRTGVRNALAQPINVASEGPNSHPKHLEADLNRHPEAPFALARRSLLIPNGVFPHLLQNPGDPVPQPRRPYSPDAATPHMCLHLAGSNMPNRFGKPVDS